MAGNKIPDRPEKLTELLKKEQRDYDCTPCRVVGMFYLSPYSLPASHLPGAFTDYVSCVRQAERHSSASLATAISPV